MSVANIDDLKAEICAHIDALGDELLRVSHAIHARPELCYEERFASASLADLLARNGFDVELGAFGIATAFAGRVGTIGSNVVVCCEYDALPGIGHGCGHNIIGAAGAGAAIALARIGERVGGSVTVLGCPAEEGGGGKIRLLEAGAFAGGDVAMMIHPEPANVEVAPYLANDRVFVEMHGKAAHASSSAWAGVNALDALVAGYNTVHALRGTLRPDEKVFGIITNGGTADNVIPAFASAQFKIRARTQRRLDRLRSRLSACFDGAALQFGAQCDLRWEGGYADLQANRVLAAAFRRNGERLGRAFIDPSTVPIEVAGSTDMGNVSYAVATIHPVLDVGAKCAGHSVEMAAAAIATGGDRCVIDGAKSLAMTALDVWTDASLREQIAAEFDALRNRVSNGVASEPSS